MKRKVAVVTGSRAEYGLLRWLMQAMRDDPCLELQLIVTGMHLSPEFGLTYREIEADGFRIDRKIEMLTSSDSAVGVTKSMGLGLIGFSEVFAEIRPDLIVVLGDRFEIFCAAAAALVARVPVAHLHGGETTEGAMDEALRHSISKMSHLHFVAAEAYRRRVIQLGEDPTRVFCVGGLGVDAIKRVTLLDRAALEAALGFQFESRNLLVTFHPVTLENGTTAQQTRELLAALAALEDTRLIFTMPNADTDGREAMVLIREFAASCPHARVFDSLGQVRYLSCLRYVDGVVGNSSSGLAEAPSFQKPTINIGDRQHGRLKAASVIDCLPQREAIAAALARMYSREFQNTLAQARNPYGDGGASDRILPIIREHSLEALLKKKFFDFPHA